MNYSMCQQYSLPNPPTRSETCALYAGANSTAILQKCCNNGPIANYSDNGVPTYCFQYCNITDPTLTYTAAVACISEEVTKVNFTPEYLCGPKLNTTSMHSNAPRLQAQHLGWLLLTAAIAGEILGMGGLI